MEPHFPDRQSKKNEIVWDRECDLLSKKVDRCKDQQANVFAIVICHCEDSTKHQTECLSKCEKAQQSRNAMDFLKMIEELAFGSNNCQCSLRQVTHAWIPLSCAKWQEDKNLTAYCKRFIDVIARIDRACSLIKFTAVALKNPKCKTQKTQWSASVAIKCLLPHLWKEPTTK